MEANAEFRELLKMAGWSQAEAGRQLELTSATVSRYVNDVDPPDKQTLRLFRMMLEAEGKLSFALRETSPSYGAVAFDSNVIVQLVDEISKLETQMDRVRELKDQLRPNSVSTGRRAKEKGKRSPIEQVGDAIEEAARGGISRPKP